MVSAAGLLCPEAQEVAEASVAGCYDGIHLMHIAVGEDDAAILFRYGGNAVDADAVEVRLPVEDAQLAVVHVGQTELMLVLREIGDVVRRLVAVVENAVEDDDLAYAVQRALVGEAVPRGLGDDALTAERVEVELDGVVGRREDGVVAACRQQLLQRGLGVGTDGHRAQQA